RRRLPKQQLLRFSRWCKFDTAGEFVEAAGGGEIHTPKPPILPKPRPNDPPGEFASSIKFAPTGNRLPSPSGREGRPGRAEATRCIFPVFSPFGRILPNGDGALPAGGMGRLPGEIPRYLILSPR